ncbi:MAG: helix-turn-helix domain-containing protein [Rhodospirillaceae bacterium]|nr:helix-turn-helix domain-containing protein [Rhodospirillaceae bacterium]
MSAMPEIAVPNINAASRGKPTVLRTRPVRDIDDDDAKIDRELLRSASRCFDALEIINAYRSISAPQMARLLRVPRTTVARILRTLMQRGYISRTEDGRYALTLEVNRLSSGYAYAERALPHLRAILMKEAQSYLWPLAVVLPQGNALYTYAPTDGLTPYKLFCIPEGSRVPYIATAAGTVYLAYCTADERAAIMHMGSEGTSNASRSKEKLCATEGALSKDCTAAQLEGDIRLARAQGYLAKSEHSMGSARLNDMYHGQTVVAVPLLVDGDICGTLVTRIITSAVPKSDIGAKIYPRLQRIAADLASAWCAATAGPDVPLAAE